MKAGRAGGDTTVRNDSRERERTCWNREGQLKVSGREGEAMGAKAEDRLALPLTALAGGTDV